MTEFYVFLDFLDIYINTNFYFSIIIFFIFLLTFHTFAIPGSLIFVVSAGYFFGIYIGYIISILSGVLGSFILFTASRLFLKKFFFNIYNKYSSKVDQYISSSSIEYLILFRLIPGPPLLIQNICLSLLKVHNIKFILSSFIGFTPIMILAVYLGSKIRSIESIKNISVNDIISREFLIFSGFVIFLLTLRIILKKKN